MKQAFLIADLQYGDAGKGSIVDFLSRQHPSALIVRYNGGSQAAHNVVTPDGQHHTFAQFGSGMFVPGTRTHLSRFMLIDPLAMLNEGRHLPVDNPFTRTTVERGALIITPFQQISNQLKEEARGESRHGSCGMGVGETMSDSLQYGADVLRAGDLSDPIITRRKLRFIRDVKSLPIPDADEIIDACVEMYQYFAGLITLVDEDYLPQQFKQTETIIFEGAQGVLLDEWYGFHPHTTWSNITYENADSLLAGYDGQITRIGIMRGYATRHGAGPFMTEDAALTRLIPDYHNGLNDWQGHFRVGYFDGVALKYALSVIGGVDYLAITNLDRLQAFDTRQFCTYYDYAPSDMAEAATSTFFDMEQGKISGIKMMPKPNLEHQAQLTEHLWHVSPVYQTVQPADYVDVLEDWLGYRIGIVSAGLTANDKQYRTD